MADTRAEGHADRGITCQNLGKSYGKVVALDNLSMRVHAGRITGLIGPNGAGKTSALRCMAGIIPASRGEVRINGIPMDIDAVAAKRLSCFVPDTPHLFDYLTVEEHLRFAGRIYSLEDVDTRIVSLLRLFELQDKASALPQSLSRGMKQKVAICLAFLHDPQAIILDEPLTGLDPLGIRNMKDAIIDRARNQGAAVIVSSHQLDVIEEICDEMVLLDKGRCIAQGTRDDLQARLNVDVSELSLEEIFLHLLEDKRSRAAQ
jgi:ABC-2 type transport system ATP-binding protein